MSDTGYPALPVPGVWRKARSEHICVECGKPIAVGSRYFEYTGGTPAYQSGHAYDRQCAIRVWSDFGKPAQQPQDKPQVSIVMALSESATLVIYLNDSIAIEAVTSDEEPAALVLNNEEARTLASTLVLWFGAREKPGAKTP